MCENGDGWGGRGVPLATYHLRVDFSKPLIAISSVGVVLLLILLMDIELAEIYNLSGI